MTSKNMTVNESGSVFRSVVLGRSNPPRLQQISTGSVVPCPPITAGRRISPRPSTHEQSSCHCNIKASVNVDKNNKIDNFCIFKPAELRPVPFYYPMEKTSKVVEEDNTTTADFLLPAIVSRITNCMQSLSIHAVYDNKNARASLTTIEGVQMQLSLWDMSAETNENKKKILVELQRRCGDCVIFHQYCRNILKFATNAVGDDIERSNGKEDSNSKRKHNSEGEKPKAKKQVLSTRTIAMTTTGEEEEYENTIVALEIAHNLLMKDRVDAKQLGLESLCFLTDPNNSNTSANAKVIASRVVLFGRATTVENQKLAYTEQHFLDIKEIVSSLIGSVRGQDEYEHADDGNFRNLGLTIFANALGNSTGAGLQNVVLKDGDGCENIISSLVKDLSQSEKTSPHTAYLSTKCLRLLCSSSKVDVKQKAVMELEGDEKYDIIHTALDVGIRTHRKLELECRKFLEEVFLLSN